MGPLGRDIAASDLGVDPLYRVHLHVAVCGRWSHLGSGRELPAQSVEGVGSHRHSWGTSFMGQMSWRPQDGIVGLVLGHREGCSWCLWIKGEMARGVGYQGAQRHVGNRT